MVAMRGVDGRMLRRVGCAVLGTSAIAFAGCSVPQVKIVQPGAKTKPTPAKTTTSPTPTTPPVVTTPTTTPPPVTQLPPTTGEAPASRPGTVTWQGGPVQHHPRIYTIFISDGSSDAQKTVTEVNNMVQSLKGSPWGGLLTEYHDQHGHVADDIQLAGTATIKRALTSSIDTTGIIDSVIAQNGWRVTPDSQFVLVLPPHILSPGAAGGHNYLTRYPGKSYAFSLIAGANATVSPVTNAVAHEIAETITDPQENAWFVTGRQATGEIEDLCDNSVVDQPDGTGASNELNAVLDLRTNKCGPSGAEVKYQHIGE